MGFFEFLISSSSRGSNLGVAKRFPIFASRTVDLAHFNGDASGRLEGQHCRRAIPMGNWRNHQVGASLGVQNRVSKSWLGMKRAERLVARPSGMPS